MHELTEYSSVSRWLAGSMAPPSRRAQSLDVLRRFCAAEGADPDELIARGNQSRDAKNDIMRRLVKWVEAETDDERQRHEMQNTVRSFFIRNGLRVLTKPYPDVYRRSSPPSSSGGTPAPPAPT
jgi:hypothetical protein